LDSRQDASRLVNRICSPPSSRSREPTARKRTAASTRQYVASSWGEKAVSHGRASGWHYWIDGPLRACSRQGSEARTRPPKPRSAPEPTTDPNQFSSPQTAAPVRCDVTAPEVEKVSAMAPMPRRCPSSCRLCVSRPRTGCRSTQFGVARAQTISVFVSRDHHDRRDTGKDALKCIRTGLAID